MFDLSVYTEVAELCYDSLKEISVVPLKITYIKNNTGTKNKFTQSVETTPETITINTTCIVKHGKGLGEGESTIVLTSIPIGKYGIYLLWENRLMLHQLSDSEKNSMTFELYPNSENPLVLKPNVKNAYTWYFANYEDFPQLQVFICDSN